jgi:hypothetical protein
MLQRMCEHRNVPTLGKRFEHADVIEMAVRHDDCPRAGILSKAVLGRPRDGTGRQRNPGVNQHPFARSGAGHANENDVDDRQSLVSHIRQHISRSMICR